MKQKPAIFIGASEREHLPALVLEWSIRRSSSTEVEVTNMSRFADRISEPLHPANRQKTAFSFQRFMIPELAGFRGRGIYLDSDMLVFADIAQLWNYPMENLRVLSCVRPGLPSQCSVLLMDCERLDWRITELIAALDRGDLTYEGLMTLRFQEGVDAILPETWNSIENYVPGVTRLLHFSNQDIQPWRCLGNPLESTWMESFAAAVVEGFVHKDLVQEHVEKGYVRRELLDFI